MLRDISDEDLDMAIFEMNVWNLINDLDDHIIELKAKETLTDEEKVDLENSTVRIKDLLERINNKKGLKWVLFLIIRDCIIYSMHYSFCIR